MASKAQCAIDGCIDPVLARGWCPAHYRRWLRNGNPMGGRHIRIGCSVEDCPRPHSGLGYCTRHYMRFVRFGDPLYLPQRDVDETAVERAVAGRPPLRMTTAEREEAIRRLHARGLRDGEIARRIGMGRGGVRTARIRLSLPLNEPGTPYSTGANPLVSKGRSADYALAAGDGRG